jgi:hypothetical protein
MAKTLENARDVVRDLLDEQTPSDWTNAELNRYINSRYHEVYTAVVSVFEDYYMTTANFDTVEDQQEYDSTDGVPTDIYKIRRVELNYDVSNSNSSPSRCLPIDNIDVIKGDLAFTNASYMGVSGINAGYYKMGYGSNFKIGFIPIPDKAGTDAVKLWYIQELSDLVNNSDSINIPYVDRYWMIIVKGAVADALRQGQQDRSEVNNLEAFFAASLDKMQAELEDRIAEETKSVIDVTGEYLDFGSPF